MDRESKKRIIDELIETRSKLQRVQFRLALEGEDTRELDGKLDKLDSAIAAMRRDLHERWQGKAGTVESELKRANRRVQRRIRDINKGVKRAERAVALLGDVEEIIGKIRNIVP